MWRKNLMALVACIAFAAGCAPVPKPPVAAAAAAAPPRREPAAAAAPTPGPTPAPTKAKTPPKAPPPQRPAMPAPSPKPAPGLSSLPGMINAHARWVDYGQSMVVTRGDTPDAPTVPLFRQAIVLAAVRAAVAGCTSPPVAEFKRGLLTLTFAGGSPAEIANAINRAIAVPDVVLMGVMLGS